MSFEREIDSARREHTRLIDEFLETQREALGLLASWCARTLDSGGKLLLFGNGGSAAQAQHLAAEFINRYEQERRALAAIALTADGAVLTSVANDTRFVDVFSRQIAALGKPGDLALALSTSGASPNVLEALRVARVRGIRTAAMLGGGGGAAVEAADLALVVPGRETPRIQEVQLFAGHLLCRWVERLLGLDTPATLTSPHERSTCPESRSASASEPHLPPAERI